MSRSAKFGRTLLSLALASAVAAGCSASPGRQAASGAPATHPSGSAATLAWEHDVRQQVRVLTSAGYFPGVLVAVRRDGTSRTVTSGLARIHPREPLTAGYRFPIASLTKTLTAVVVMQLVDRHRLRLDAKVDTVLPGLLRYGNRITFAELLSHRSGLPDPVNDPRYQKLLPQGRPPTSRELVGAAARLPLDFPPGTKAEYSNTNFEVLGLAVQSLTRRHYEEVLRSRVFGPAGMTTASMGRTLTPGHPLLHGYELGHDVTGSIPYGLASGGAVMTATDVDLFDAALFSGRLVSAHSLQQMSVDRDGNVLGWDGYGYGLAMRGTPCGRALGHSGRLRGYVTEAWTLPSRDRTVVVVANRDENGGNGDSLGGVIDSALCH